MRVTLAEIERAVAEVARRTPGTRVEFEKGSPANGTTHKVHFYRYEYHNYVWGHSLGELYGKLEACAIAFAIHQAD